MINVAKKLYEQFPNGLYEGRKILWITSFGSHNYGTNTHSSDFDFRIFVEPTKEDIFEGKFFQSNVSLQPNYDVNIHDVRSLIKLWQGSNPTYLEMLVSKYQFATDSFASFLEQSVLPFKDEIALSNPSKLFNSLKGLLFSKKKQLESLTPKPKTASEFFRLWYILENMFLNKNKSTPIPFHSLINLNDQSDNPSTPLIPLIFSLKNSEFPIPFEKINPLLEQLTTLSSQEYITTPSNPSTLNVLSSELFTFLEDSIFKPSYPSKKITTSNPNNLSNKKGS